MQEGTGDLQEGKPLLYRGLTLNAQLRPQPDASVFALAGKTGVRMVL